MKIRTLILVSMLLPVLLLTLPWLGARFYRPELPAGADWSESDFETYGDDASLLRGTLSEPESGDARGFVLLLPDSSLDRDWTHGGKGFAAGRILARRLAALGFRVARFDQRGTGSTRQSGRNYAAPNNMARDALLVLKHLRSPVSSRATPAPAVDDDRAALTILAQGDGCAAALRLANEELASQSPRLLLTGCLLTGSLLDQWLGRIRTNMRRLGVAPAVQAEAERRIQAWRAARPWETVATVDEAAGRDSQSDEHPDLQALDRALEQMLDERLLDFTRQAAAFDFDRELEKSLKRTGVRVFHMIGRQDLVLPAGAIETAARTAARWQARYPDRFHFRTLAATDHFLAERQASQPGSLVLLMENLNPLRRISPAFLAALDETLAAPRSEEGATSP